MFVVKAAGELSTNLQSYIEQDNVIINMLTNPLTVTACSMHQLELARPAKITYQFQNLNIR